MHTGRQKYPAWTSGSEFCPPVQEEARSRFGTEAGIPHESAVRACRRARRRENTSARCRQNKSRTSSPRAWRPSAARRQRPCGPLGCTMTRGGAQRGTFRPHTPPHCAHGPYKGRGGSCGAEQRAVDARLVRLKRQTPRPAVGAVQCQRIFRQGRTGKDGHAARLVRGERIAAGVQHRQKRRCGNGGFDGSNAIKRPHGQKRDVPGLFFAGGKPVKALGMRAGSRPGWRRSSEAVKIPCAFFS